MKEGKVILLSNVQRKALFFILTGRFLYKMQKALIFYISFSSGFPEIVIIKYSFKISP